MHVSFLSRSSFEISLSKESNVPPCYLLSSHFFLVDRIPTTLSFFHHFFSRIFKLVRSLQTSIPNVIPSSSNGNIEFNPNYPCFFERIFTNFPFHHFFFLSFSLSFPSRDQPRVSSSSSSSSFQPYHVHFNLLLARSFAPRTQRKIFVPPRLHFQLPSPPHFPSFPSLPTRIQRATCLLFLLPPTLLVPSPALSRISSFPDPGRER